MVYVRPLLTLENDDQIDDIALMIVDQNMSAREVEQYIKNLDRKTNKPSVKKVDANLNYVKELMQNKLNTKVEVTNKKITIDYTDTDDLNRILDLLNCIEE